MKRSIWFLLVFPILILMVVSGVYWSFLANNQFWLVAGMVLAAVWLLFVGLVANIDRQVEENPYYTQMILKKRDEVRELRKVYAANHKGV